MTSFDNWLLYIPWNNNLNWEMEYVPFALQLSQ